jgi:DNA-binding NtrC family response regulator
MISKSARMKQVFELIRRIADTPAAVLITGESGTGKELVARAIHDASSRKAGPYVPINCGALASTIIEGELFGHVRGAFTGATADKKGAFEAAEGGSIFLDEIGELPLELQPKLLRVLEQRAIRRVGGTSEVQVDCRVIAATHRNLQGQVDNGQFRQDLFHRLHVLSVEIPPLRDRPEDILPLARHFLRAQSEKPPLLAPDAEAALSAHRWPGNVRELRNVILRAVLMSSSDVLTASDFKFSESAYRSPHADARATVRRVDEEERLRIIRVLEECRSNRAEAARRLGMSKSTFHDRLRRLGIPLKSSTR